MWLTFGGGWISSIRHPVRFLVFVSVCGKFMADLIAQLVFIFSVIDWGGTRDVIGHYYWRVFEW